MSSHLSRSGMILAELECLTSYQTFKQTHLSSEEWFFPLMFMLHHSLFRKSEIMVQASEQSQFACLCLFSCKSFPSAQHLQRPLKQCQLPLYTAIQSQAIWLIGVISLIRNISMIAKQGIDQDATCLTQTNSAVDSGTSLAGQTKSGVS